MQFSITGMIILDPSHEENKRNFMHKSGYEFKGLTHIVSTEIALFQSLIDKVQVIFQRIKILFSLILSIFRSLDLIF